MKHKMQQYQFWALTSFFIFISTFTLTFRFTKEFMTHDAIRDLEYDKKHKHTEIYNQNS